MLWPPGLQQVMVLPGLAWTGLAVYTPRQQYLHVLVGELKRK